METFIFVHFYLFGGRICRTRLGSDVPQTRHEENASLKGSIRRRVGDAAGDALMEKDDNEAPIRRKRQRIAKSFGDDFIVYLVDDTPTSIAEAYASPDADDWKEAVHNEMDSILSNGTWELSERPPWMQTCGLQMGVQKEAKT